MSIQRMLIKESLKYIPKINELIRISYPLESIQMENLALRNIMNSPIPIDKMNDGQIESFQNTLIDKFKHHGWLK